MDKKINAYEHTFSDISSCNLSVLDEIGTKNINNLIIGNLNINPLSSKFDQLKVSIREKIDILKITETELDSNFCLEQFVISGYSKPYKLERSRSWGGLIIFVREDKPNKKLRFFNMPEKLESIFVEINLFKTKCLVCGCYHPPN